MKKNLLLFIALLLAGLNSIAQWTLLSSEITTHLNHVVFTDTNNGYAVGEGGVILKTIDGGTNWTFLSSGTTGNLSSVCFTDTNTGFVVGTSFTGQVYSGFILKTTDGGISWTTQATTQSYSGLASIYFTDANSGHAVGWAEGPVPFLQTSNGGVSWAASSQTIYGVLWSVFFTSSSTGYAVGSDGGGVDPGHSHGVIFKTTDGGASWTDIPNISASNLSSVYFTDANKGFAVGYNYSIAGPNGGVILITTDGGTTWDTLSCGSTNGLNSVFFTEASTGYAVGDAGTILKTIDGGLTWTSQTSGTSKNLHSVYFTDANSGYAVGNDGTILKTSNGGYGLGVDDQRPKISLKNSLSIYPNPATEKIFIGVPEGRSNLNGTISIYGSAGGEMIKQQVHGAVNEINVSNFPSGIYLIKLVNSERTLVGKFIKE